MPYKYLAIICVIGVICFIFDKLSSIAASLKNIHLTVNHLSMQVGVVNERLHDIRTSVDDCKWDVEKLKSTAEEIQTHLLCEEKPSNY